MLVLDLRICSPIDKSPVLKGLEQERLGSAGHRSLGITFALGPIARQPLYNTPDIITASSTFRYVPRMGNLMGRQPAARSEDPTLSDFDGSIPKCLIVEAEREVQSILKSCFRSEIQIDPLPRPDLMARETRYDVVVWNDSSPSDSYSGMEMLERLAKDSRETPIIVISDATIKPERCGIKAENYYQIARPVDWSKLLILITQVLSKCPTAQDTVTDPDARIPLEFEGMLGISLPMREVFQRIIEVASVDVPVLISGETGTGKDLIAAAIHKRSDRKDQPYVAVNTGAMTRELMASELFGHERGAYTGAAATHRGVFEQAHRGTIFLDEISTMEEKAQVSLLRVLETKSFRRVGGEKDVHVDARVLAATNESLEESVKQRRFREDLYYRLDVFQIHVPPLRERPGAVTFLTDHFVTTFNEIHKKQVSEVSFDTYRCLRGYPWPGNVRELKNVVQRAVVMAQGKEFTADLLPVRIREASESQIESDVHEKPICLGMSLDEVEKKFIRLTLESTGGNKTEAAIALGISRRALYNKLKKFGLNLIS